jgi:Zn-dependent protease
MAWSAPVSHEGGRHDNLGATSTRMTLAFRIGKIPVQILPWFFFVALLLGGGAGVHPASAAMWVAIVFVSVLVHELGHATAGLLFGLEPRIQMHAMGGTTSWGGAPAGIGTGARIVISLAGPMAGFVLAGAFMTLHASLSAHPLGDLGESAYRQICWINVGWGLLNLLPILPLDGGNVLLQVLRAFMGGGGERPARLISIGLALAGLALAVVACLITQSFGSIWPAFLAASFIASNWRGLREHAAAEHDVPIRSALAPAYAALEAKNGPRLVELARPAALTARSAPVRAEALQLLAYGFLLEGRVADADAAIAALPAGYQPHASLVSLRRAAPVRATT